MVDNVVVGWKDEASSRSALQWALADRPDVTVTIVHVVGAGTPVVETFAADSRAARARVDLMEVAERVRSEHPSLIVRSELLSGDPVGVLVDLSGPGSLLVVGTGRQNARSAHSWSVETRVAAHARGPVAVVPATFSSGHGVVVGVDDPEDDALRFAAEEARRRGETLHAVRAWQGPPAGLDRGRADPDYQRSLESMYEDILADALESTVDEYPELTIRQSVVEGEPQDVLAESSVGAALLVVGNRGLPRRPFLGSVSRAVVLGARIPTVVVNARRD